MLGVTLLFSLGVLVVASRGRVDLAAVDAEHPCVGASEAGRRTATATRSTVRVTHLVRLMTRALHRLGDLQHTYASQRLRSTAIRRMLGDTSFIAMPDLHPNLDATTGVQHKVDHTLRQFMIALMTHIVYVDHVRRNALYWAGDNPDELAFRETTYARDVGELQGNTLLPLACSIKQVMTLRGINIDVSALERMKEIQYAYPSSQYLGDMQAYIVLTSLHRLVSESREFVNAVAKAGLLRRV